jgi:hypothetical protein
MIVDFCYRPPSKAPVKHFDKSLQNVFRVQEMKWCCWRLASSGAVFHHPRSLLRKSLASRRASLSIPLNITTNHNQHPTTHQQCLALSPSLYASSHNQPAKMPQHNVSANAPSTPHSHAPSQPHPPAPAPSCPKSASRRSPPSAARRKSSKQP